MSHDNQTLLVLGIYGLVVAVLCGVYREVSDEDWGDALPFALLWPVIPPAACVVGAFWLLTWIGRGPAKLIGWLLFSRDSRQHRKLTTIKLPRAEVRK